MANRGPIVEGRLISPRVDGQILSEDDEAFDFEYNAVFGGTETVASGGSADVLEAAWLNDAFINLDPEGSMTLTTDTAANIIAGPLANATVCRVVLRNAANGAETITLAGGDSVTARTHEGAADLVVGQNEAAELTFVKTSGTTCDLYITIFT